MYALLLEKDHVRRFYIYQVGEWFNVVYTDTCLYYRGNIFNVDQLIIAIPSCRVVCATDLLKATYAIPYTGKDLVALHEPSHRPWPAVWRWNPNATGGFNHWNPPIFGFHITPGMVTMVGGFIQILISSGSQKGYFMIFHDILMFRSVSQSFTFTLLQHFCHHLMRQLNSQNLLRQVLRRPGMCRLGTQEQMDGEVSAGSHTTFRSTPDNAGMSSLQKVELLGTGSMPKMIKMIRWQKVELSQ